MNNLGAPTLILVCTRCNLSGVLVKKDGSVRTITKNHDTLDRNEFERICQLGGFYRKQVTYGRECPHLIRPTVVPGPR